MKHLSDCLAAIVEHGAQDLGGHDQAAGFRLDGDIPCHQAHVLELLLELSILLQSHTCMMMLSGQAWRCGSIATHARRMIVAGGPPPAGPDVHLIAESLER